ncbi:MAG: hypothetical protein J5764_05470, partial [Bacteroidales bacterium]|nr:hypothetical protein [Bacteroidales bacterium]
MRRLSILIALVLLCDLNLGAAEASFRHITSREGLPYTWVRDIYRDSDGYMWFSTIYGAYRYDGRFFEEYSFLGQDEGRRLSVFHVREDSKGNLWFCTEAGLFRHDPHTAETSEPLFPAQSVYALVQTPDGTLWVGTVKGLFRIREGGTPEIVGGNEATVVSLITDSA